MHTKAKYLIGQLRSLGFQDWQCAVAIMQHGSHLEACIAFLLEDHITSEADSRAYMVAHALAPPIDVSEELQMLAEAQVPPVHHKYPCTRRTFVWASACVPGPSQWPGE